MPFEQCLADITGNPQFAETTQLVGPSAPSSAAAMEKWDAAFQFLIQAVTQTSKSLRDTAPGKSVTTDSADAIAFATMVNNMRSKAQTPPFASLDSARTLLMTILAAPHFSRWFNDASAACDLTTILGGLSNLDITPPPAPLLGPQRIPSARSNIPPLFPPADPSSFLPASATTAASLLARTTGAGGRSSPTPPPSSPSSDSSDDDDRYGEQRQKRRQRVSFQQRSS